MLRTQVYSPDRIFNEVKKYFLERHIQAVVIPTPQEIIVSASERIVSEYSDNLISTTNTKDSYLVKSTLVELLHGFDTRDSQVLAVRAESNRRIRWLVREIGLPQKTDDCLP